ncbi:ATP-dependent nuclease [Corynebacterium cystitidis]|uniref:ATP-dependent nuclease n=1 Tax=Corynebacterium cystitidis TaxID=35757 RepID=UPI00211DDF79|nr:AAA family ATPase [Corynebacterium cystitidis]
MIKEVRVKNFKALRDFKTRFNRDFNVIVGANGSGKSTLLEAIGLALSGRFRGQWPEEAKSPYWFNQKTVDDYFFEVAEGKSPPVPEISIELILDKDTEDPDLSRLEGKLNRQKVTERGLAFEVKLSDEFRAEYEAFIDEWRNRYKTSKEGGRNDRLLPIEYFDVYWRSFAAPERLPRRPKGVDFALIDAKSNLYGRGIDRFTRELLTDNIPNTVGASLSVNLRAAFSETAGDALASVNNRILEETKSAPQQFGVQIDPSNFIQWQYGVAPSIAGLPFDYAGQGAQSVAKVEVALLQRQDKAKTILIEEPENNLSHTKLRALLARIAELGQNQQLIVTTHSSFVLNRLGIDSLILMGEGNTARFNELPDDDVKFFQKLPNFDTLRLILGDQVILVEGISDLLIVDEAIKRRYGKSSERLGVDIISMEGTKHKRWLDLAKLLDKPVIAIRDNDGKLDGHWEKTYKDSIGRSRLFVGEYADGKTLEDQILTANKEKMKDLLIALDLQPDTDYVEWATSEKANAALQLINLDHNLWNIPTYIQDAVEALNVEEK